MPDPGEICLDKNEDKQEYDIFGNIRYKLDNKVHGSADNPRHIHFSIYLAFCDPYRFDQ